MEQQQDRARALWLWRRDLEIAKRADALMAALTVAMESGTDDQKNAMTTALIAVDEMLITFGIVDPDEQSRR